MTNAVLSNADTRENGTSLNHEKVIEMGIDATTLLSHVQAEMSQQRRNNIRSIVEPQYVSLCGPKPGSKVTMQKPKNEVMFLLSDIKSYSKYDIFTQPQLSHVTIF